MRQRTDRSGRNGSRRGRIVWNLHDESALIPKRDVNWHGLVVDLERVCHGIVGLRVPGIRGMVEAHNKAIQPNPQVSVRNDHQLAELHRPCTGRQLSDR